MSTARSQKRAADLFPVRDLPTLDDLRELSKRFPGLDPEATEAYLSFLRVATEVLATMETRLARHGLSPGRFAVLMQLLRHEMGNEGLTPSELAEKTGVTRATITGLVDGLAAEGLVERRKNPHDRRSHLLHLTKSGRERLERMLPGYFDAIGRLMQDVGGRERTRFLRLLGAIRTGLEEIRDE